MPSEVRAAGAGANVTGVGTFVWNNPNNILTSDNTRAATAFADVQISNYLVSSLHGFTIPGGSIIDGIIVRIERSELSTSSNITDEFVRLVKGGTVQTAENKADTATEWPTTDTSKTYGTSTDLWTNTWTTTDINASDFGVALSIDQNSEGSAQARVDYVEIEVHYTAGGANPIVMMV